MRYRLRTLLIAAIFGPPILGLLWFVAIWARFALPAIIRDLTQPLALPGMLALIVLVVYSIVAPPPGEKPAVMLHSWQHVALWTSQFLAQWHWFLVLIHLGGWIFVWGDRGPPFSDAAMAATAGVAAATAASVTSVRVLQGWATITYVITILCFVGPMLSIAALFWLGYLLR